MSEEYATSSSSTPGDRAAAGLCLPQRCRVRAFRAGARRSGQRRRGGIPLGPGRLRATWARCVAGVGRDQTRCAPTAVHATNHMKPERHGSAGYPGVVVPSAHRNVQVTAADDVTCRQRIGRSSDAQPWGRRSPTWSNGCAPPVLLPKGRILTDRRAWSWSLLP